MQTEEAKVRLPALLAGGFGLLRFAVGGGAGSASRVSQRVRHAVKACLLILLRGKGRWPNMTACI